MRTNIRKIEQSYSYKNKYILFNSEGIHYFSYKGDYIYSRVNSVEPLMYLYTIDKLTPDELAYADIVHKLGINK